MKELIGIDIFSGAGGLSIGALAAGIHIPIAIEKDSFAAQTFKKNHPETIVITEDIREIDPKNPTCSGFLPNPPDNFKGGSICSGFFYLFSQF